MSTKHSKAAAEFLKNKKQAAWHDETLWLVRAKRDRLSKEVPEWEELRNMACATKLYSNSHLDELLVEFENNARANGAHVYWAKDADEYCNIVYNILNQHGVKHFIKSKSMLAEECELNPFFESKGIDKPHPAGKRGFSFCDAQDHSDHIRKIKSHKDDKTGNQVSALFCQNNS